MSVVNGFIFNKNEGALISDAMFSMGDRQYVNLTKLQGYSLAKNSITAVIGGVGSGQFIVDLLSKTKELLEKNPEVSFESADDFLANVAVWAVSEKDRLLDGLLKNHTGLGLKELRQGKYITKDDIPSEIPPDAKEFYTQLISANHVLTDPWLNSEFLSIASDESGTKLHHLHISMEAVFRRSIVPYRALGSGRDQADPVLSSFYEKFRREDRADINRYDCLVALFEATDKAAKRNQGVGGIYDLAIIKDGQLIMPCENNIKLSTEIVKGYKKKYLSREFTHTALENLLYQNAPHLVWDKNMFAEAGKRKDELSHLLRGYTV